MKKQDIKVDFDNSILALSNSLLRHYGVETEYKSLPILDKELAVGYQNVVFLILDCFGKNILEYHLNPHDFLYMHRVADISTVFPPTTAAATITFHSGLPPIASGWIGWMNYFPQYGHIIENFRNVDFYTGEELTTPHPAETILKYKSIYEKITEQNPEVEYHQVFPAFVEGGAGTFEELCRGIENAVNSSDKRKIISAYWTEPNHTMHYNGIHSAIAAELIRDINNRLEKMCADLHDTLVIISADHGGIDVDDVIIEHQDLLDTFRLPPTIESRTISFWIKDGCHDEFVHLFNKYYGEEFVLFTKEEFLQAHILGYGKQHPLIDSMLGEYVAIATGTLSINYDSGKREKKLFKATHAGYTKEEMTVPLILVKCKKVFDKNR